VLIIAVMLVCQHYGVLTVFTALINFL